jgi:tetratricopeptide (TPR) repeat protein
MRRALLLALALIALGCGQDRPPSGSAPPAKSPAVALREEGDALLAKADYAGAAVKYEAAIALLPDDVGLHYAAGTAYSYLNRKADAVREFRWVLRRGQPNSTEVQGARRWLAAAGLLAAEAEEGAREGGGAGKAAPTRTGIAGKIEWPGVHPGDPTVAVRIVLTGDDLTNQQFKDGRIARVGGRYTFPELAPGNYRLVGSAMRPELPLWDHRVSVERGKVTTLDLSQANSSAPPDALVGRDKR